MAFGFVADADDEFSPPALLQRSHFRSASPDHLFVDLGCFADDGDLSVRHDFGNEFQSVLNAERGFKAKDRVIALRDIFKEFALSAGLDGNKVPEGKAVNGES